MNEMKAMKSYSDKVLFRFIIFYYVFSIVGLTLYGAVCLCCKCVMVFLCLY